MGGMPMLPRLLALLLLAGCASAGPGLASTHAPAGNEPDAQEASCVAPGLWADADGKPVDGGALLRRAASAPAVLLGEQHDSPEHHRWQLHTLAAIHALNPKLAVGLEMLPRRVQPALDRWSAGVTDESRFLKESDWARLWGFDPQLYLPILHFARMNRLPLVALNVERSLVARTGKEGWSAIPAAEREGVGDPAPPPRDYLDRLSTIMAQHGSDTSEERFRRFVEAQSVWDRAMAERIAATHRETGRTVVAILGMGHVENRHGVPHQLAALGVPDSLALLPWDEDRPCDELNGRVADAVFGVEQFGGTSPSGPRLGIVVEMEEGGLRVQSVQQDGIGAAAGLAPGDLVTAAAGTPLRQATDLTEVLDRQAPGTWLPLTVLRDQDSRELVAKFPAR